MLIKKYITFFKTIYVRKFVNLCCIGLFISIYKYMNWSANVFFFFPKNKCQYLNTTCIACLSPKKKKEWNLALHEYIPTHPSFFASISAFQFHTPTLFHSFSLSPLHIHRRLREHLHESHDFSRNKEKPKTRNKHTNETQPNKHRDKEPLEHRDRWCVLNHWTSKSFIESNLKACTT